LKICILSADFLPNIGGIAAHVHELSKELVRQGNDVHLITFRNKILETKYEELEGIKVHRIYLPKIRILGRLFYAIFEIITLLSLLKRENIEVIHSHSLIPDDFAAMFVRNRKVIITEHSSRFLRSVETRKKTRLYRLLLNHADRITGPSQELVDAFITIGVNKEKTSFIPNGVDIHEFNPLIKGKEIKSKYNIKSNERVILCPRRLVPKNGVSYLIMALPNIITRFRNIKCLIVGDGTELNNLKKASSRLNIEEKVIFTHRIPNYEMPKYYAASDIVVLPSLKEATSIAGLEAMASGKPLVGTDVGGIPYIIEPNKTGILVPSRDSQRISNAVIELLNDDQKRISMGINARKKAVNEFSWKIVAKRFQKIYTKRNNA
jgi:glycosyltransferase involved in cell wall biosynthesis